MSTARWLAILTVSVCMVPARAGTVSLSGPSAAAPGGTVAVAVTLSSDLSSVYALQGCLAYDPAVLTPVAGQEASAPQGFWAGSQVPFSGESIPRDADLFRMNTAASGTVVFGYVKNPSNPVGSGSHVVPTTAVRLTFSVAAGAQGQTSVQLSPATINGKAVPAVLAGASDGSPLTAGAGAPLTIAFRRAGDVNADGAVNVDDVAAILRMAGGASASDAAGAANADLWPAGSPDGRVTLWDAVRLLRILDGLQG